MPRFKKVSANIQEALIDNPKIEGRIRWININDAGKDEIEYLRKKFNFDLPHLHATLGRTVAQRPIVTYNRGKDYIFMILHFPVMSKGRILPGEIEFFIGKDYLITSHTGNIAPLNELFNVCKKDGNSLLAYEFESPAILLYEVLKKITMSCYDLLDRESIAINNIEEEIFDQPDQKITVSRILNLRRNNINMRKILRTHKNTIKKLIGLENDLVKQVEVKKYYGNLIDHIKKIWENLESHKEMIEILNGTNETLLNDKISNIMKTLTIFSVIVFPLTLLAAVFGMNTVDSMPFVDSPYGFWIILAIMLLSSLFMLLFFERKRWL